MSRTHLLRNLAFSAELTTFLKNIPAFDAVKECASIQFIAEQWQGDRVLVTGELILDTKNSVDLLGVKVVFGHGSSEKISIPFEIDTAALPLYTVLLALSVASGAIKAEDVTTILTEEELEDPDDLFLRFETDFSAIALHFGPVPIQLVLQADFLSVGRHIKNNAGEPVAVEHDPDAGPLQVPIGEASITAGNQGLNIDLETPASLSLPPLMLKGTGLALELKGLVAKFSAGPLPANVAALGADKGFDDAWRGIYAEQVTLWNLDKVFPGGPANNAADHAQITASSMAIDGRGITGSLTLDCTPPSDDLLSLESVTVAFDRAWYPQTAKAIGQLELEDVGAGSHQYECRLEIDPFANENDRWRLMIALTDLSPGEPVIAINNPSPALTGAMVSIAAVLGDGDLALLIGALAAGNAAGVISWKYMALDQVTLECQLGVDGFGVIGTLGLEIEAELDIVNDPIPLVVRAGNVEVSYQKDDGFESSWSLQDGLDLTLPLDVDIGGQVTLESISLRRRDDGALVIEIGVEHDGAGDIAIGGLPNVVSLVYQPGPPERFDVELSRDGQELTLLVPGVLYAKGSLQRSDETFPAVGDLSWSDTLRASLTAYLVGDGKAARPADHLKKEHYLFALDFGLLTSTRSDGLKALVLSGDLSFKPGLPLGSTGTALYGIGLTYAQNASPDTIDADYPGWFLRKDPVFTTHASKWIPKGDHWGFGASVSLGSQPDDGRSWNVTAGLFLLLPGPVIGITGKGSLFSPPPALPAGGEGRSVEAPFAAAISLDLLNDQLKAELTADIEVAAGGTELLKLHVPAKVDASLSAPLDMSLSVGQYMPMDARVVGKALGLYEITCYVMATTEGIDDFPKPGMRLPGFAMAYGGSGGLSAGFSSAIAELKLSVRAGYDLGVSLADPPLMVGQLYIDGSLVARLACVMLNMGLRTELLVVAPDPFELSGKIQIRVDLPWPIPDIKFSGSFRLGKESQWPDSHHYPKSPISDISLFSRQHGTTQLATGESFDGKVVGDDTVVTGVPVDAGILIAFRTSVGNLDPVIGDVKTQADDTANPVWEIATTGESDDGRRMQIGWRHVVTNISLRESGQSITVQGGWGLSGVSGTAPNAENTGPGGQAVRNTLAIMAPLDSPVEKRYGTGAEVLSDLVEGWSPCETVPDPKDLVASHSIPNPEAFGIERLTARTPAFLASGHWYKLKRHAPEAGPEIRVTYQEPNPGSSLFYANFELLRSMILNRPSAFNFKVDEPLKSQKFVLTLPTAVFARDDEAQQAMNASASIVPPAGALQLHVPSAGRNRQVYFALRRGVLLDLRDQDGEAMEVTDVFRSNLVINESEVWEVKRVTLPAHEITVSACALQSKSLSNGTLGFYGALVLGADWFMDFETRQQSAQRKQQASVELISDLSDLSAAWADGKGEGLLKPDTEYEIEVTVKTYHARQFDHGELELDTDAETSTHIARFRTEADITQPLIAKTEAPIWADDVHPPWMVDTLPGKNAYHYRQNPIMVDFADALVSGRVAVHGRAVMLKLTHESGRSVQEQADVLLAEKKEALSELQDIVSEYLSHQPCLTNQDPLWLKLRHRFETLLEPGGYLAELVAEDPVANRESVTLHQWRFVSSRWMNLSDHFASHQIKHKPVPGMAASSLPAMQQRLLNAGPFEKDDGLLDSLLFNDLGEAPRQAAKEPEVLLRVHQDGLSALLFDGPEPLLSEDMTVTLERDGQQVPVAGIVSNVAGTRALICLDQIVAEGPLNVQVVHDGLTHALSLSIPTLNELLEAL